MEQKRWPKKNLAKEKGAHNIKLSNFKLAHTEHKHDKQCAICSYEMPILEFGTRQKMAQGS